MLSLHALSPPQYGLAKLQFKPTVRLQGTHRIKHALPGTFTQQGRADISRLMKRTNTFQKIQVVETAAFHHFCPHAIKVVQPREKRVHIALHFGIYLPVEVQHTALHTIFTTFTKKSLFVAGLNVQCPFQNHKTNFLLHPSYKILSGTAAPPSIGSSSVVNKSHLPSPEQRKAV